VKIFPGTDAATEIVPFAFEAIQSEPSNGRMRRSDALNKTFGVR
jgi:hypothetical protein